jgi:hypothetical protein
MSLTMSLDAVSACLVGVSMIVSLACFCFYCTVVLLALQPPTFAVAAFASHNRSDNTFLLKTFAAMRRSAMQHEAASFPNLLPNWQDNARRTAPLSSVVGSPKKINTFLADRQVSRLNIYLAADDSYAGRVVRHDMQ